MDPEELYATLRNLTTPVVAITSRSDAEANGMIANSAIRASLVPECPRLTFYCFKFHYSHELIESSGRFCLHLLHEDQVDVVRTLGFESGRDTEKLGDLSTEPTEYGLPRIENAAAYFDCRVINAMDAGPSTFFLGEVEDSGRNPSVDSEDLLHAEQLRDQLPESLQETYRQNKKSVQETARKNLSVDTEYGWDPK